MLQKSEPELHIATSPLPHGQDGVRIEVAGKIHLPNARQFQDTLQPILSSHGGSVLLDFRQVIFLDSAGLKTLLDIRKQLSLHLRALTLLLCAESQPDQVIRAARLNTIVTLLYG